MAFPSVLGSATHGDGAATATSHTITLPGSIAAGEGLLAFVSVGDNATATVNAGSSAGWTKLGQLGGAANGGLAVFWDGNASGGGSDTLIVDLSASKKVTAVGFRVSGHLTSADPDLSTFATGSDANPNPPSLSHSGGGAEDVLWFAACANNAANTTSSAPTNYTGLVTVQGLAAANGQDGVAAAYQQVNAASEDPGSAGAAFTISASRNWAAVTVAIRPAAASGVTGAHTAALTLTHAATGAVTVAGSHSKALALTASASGAVTVTGAHGKALTLAAVAAGTVLVAGAHSAALSLTASAAGTVGSAAATGEHTAAFALGHSAAGAVTVTGAAAHAPTLGASASGAVLVTGTHAASLALGADADGIVLTAVEGAHTAAFALTATGAGTVADFWTVTDPASDAWAPVPPDTATWATAAADDATWAAVPADPATWAAVAPDATAWAPAED